MFPWSLPRGLQYARSRAWPVADTGWTRGSSSNGADGASAFQTLVDRYTQTLFCQISQTAACNRFHVSEERLSRWLLMHHDRIHSDHLMITQASLGQMLGTRRSTISVSAGGLRRAGLIRFARGHVTIVDRQGLEAHCCECYAIIKTEFDRSAR